MELCRGNEVGVENPEKLNSIDPEKFGGAAYAELTFTSSKLVDNVIFREVANIKMAGQSTGKLRELEAENNTFRDRLGALEQEK